MLELGNWDSLPTWLQLTILISLIISIPGGFWWFMIWTGGSGSDSPGGGSDVG